MQLESNVAIVTGGGGAIGEGICVSLARAGADVVVSDINLESAKKVANKVSASGRKSLAVQTDVCKAEECQALVTRARETMGSLDILVCASGVGGFELRGDSAEPAILENISEEEWDLTIDVNLKGVFLCNKAVAPYFKEQKRGKIINISSIGGRHGVDFIPHYSASKAGVIVFTQAVASQLAAFNINVNTICPGVIWTPMWEKGAKALSHTYPQFKGLKPEEVFQGMVAQLIPLRRPQTAEDIGRAVVFLASSESDQITGQALNVDGGAVFS